MLVPRLTKLLPLLPAVLIASAARAQEPAISNTVPGAVAPGSAGNLQINGGNLAAAKGLWLSA
jgi:hypothetical protein